MFTTLLTGKLLGLILSVVQVMSVVRIRANSSLEISGENEEKIGCF